MRHLGLRFTVTMATAACLAVAASAQQASMDAFAPGPVFAEFGPHAPVDGIETVPADSEFAHSFDVSEMAAEGTRNRGFESAARFVNMHVAAGVPADSIRIAVVVHGKAVHDLLSAEALAARDMPANASAVMVRAMLDEGVRFIVCGQSAAAYGVGNEDFIPGVEVALSAMTAHALLQQRGYTVNPF